jgi:hypothetical protein
MSYASFDQAPPFQGRENEAFYDEGQGVPVVNTTNMTIQDIYRTPFVFLQEHKKNYKNMAPVALKGLQANSELSKMYFSDKNMKRLQRLIKKEVLNRTHGKYRLDVDQEQKDLLIAMRAVYLEHCRYLPGQVVRQIKRLNLKVVDTIVPSMITEIKQYYGYLDDINNPIKPIMRPINVNNAGRKTLPSVTTTFGL